MKKILFTVLLASAHPVDAQQFSIDNSFYDSLDVNSYALHLSGHAFFNDSMKVYYSVSTNDSIPQLLYFDSVDFTANSVIYPSGFSYNAVDSTIFITLGSYTTPWKLVHLYSRINGEPGEHIFINVWEYYWYLKEQY